MPVPGWLSFRFALRLFSCGIVATFVTAATGPVALGAGCRFASGAGPPTRNSRTRGPDEWLMWRRTLDGWGYSPLDQVNQDNVGDLRLVWSRGPPAGPPGRGLHWFATA